MVIYRIQEYQPLVDMFPILRHYHSFLNWNNHVSGAMVGVIAARVVGRLLEQWLV